MHSSPFQEELTTAIAAAQLSGDGLRQQFGKALNIRHKGEINLVTDADEAAEQAIVAEIRRHFPTDAVLAEEGTLGGSDMHRVWIIDPLDGTTNFAHGYPVFAVSIALEVDGIVQLGVVYQPMRDELFCARRNQGAQLNGETIHVSSTDRLVSSLLCSGFSYARDEIRQALPLWQDILLTAQAVRRDGAAAIDLCFVAAGRFDGFWERSLHPWDVAAGALMVAEAGGALSDYTGGNLDIRGRQIVASNGHIHADLVGFTAQS